MTRSTPIRLFCPPARVSLPSLAAAQDPASSTGASDGAALAKRHWKQIASLVSLSVQFNHDDGDGGGAGEKGFVNIQPVIPISIIPLVDQDDLAPGSGSQTGLGNVMQCLFFSPKAPTAGGLIWASGPSCRCSPPPMTSHPTNGPPG